MRIIRFIKTVRSSMPALHALYDQMIKARADGEISDVERDELIRLAIELIWTLQRSTFEEREEP